MEWYERLEGYWRDHDLLPTSAPATNDAIEAFERKFSVQMPSDVRLFFQNVNGMSTRPGHDTDENGFRFLPLQDVQAVGEFAAKVEWMVDDKVVGHNSAFVFVDYLQWCGAYAFETASPNHGAIYLLGYPDPRLVAPNLRTFVDSYLLDDPSIFQIR